MSEESDYERIHRSTGQITPSRRRGDRGHPPRPVAWDMLGTYILIVAWEFLTMPMTSHSDSWRGVWVSLFALPVSAFCMGHRSARPSWFFIFGAAGSLLFLLRFLNMDRFSLWLEYQAPGTAVIVTCWIVFTLGMGAVCWVAASLRWNPHNGAGDEYAD